MGHSTHFLTRLQRVEPWHTETALALYRDPALVRKVLTLTRVPDGAERVSIALEDGDGPHLIVTRSGAFVTCLGKGMVPYDAYAVSRADLDSIRDLHEQVARSLKELQDGTDEILALGGGDYFLNRLLRGAHLVNRSDMRMLRKLSPLISGELIQRHIKLHLEMSALRKELLPYLRDKKHEKVLIDVFDKKLKDYWCGIWAHNHIAALFSGWGPSLEWTLVCDPEHELYAELRDIELRHGLRSALPAQIIDKSLWTASRAGQQLHMVRAAWGAAHVFHLVEPVLLELMAKDFHRNWELTLKRLLALIARIQICDDDALNALLDRCARALSLGRGTDEHGLPNLVEPEDANAYTRFNTVYINFSVALRQSTDQLHEELSAVARDSLLRVLEPRRDARSRLLKPLLAQLSAHDALIYGLMFKNPVYDDLQSVPDIVTATTNAMRRKNVEDLYYEDTANPLLTTSYDPKAVVAWLKHDLLAAPQLPVKLRTPQPGRNDPCSCGSGKKFKKCCGAGA